MQYCNIFFSQSAITARFCNHFPNIWPFCLILVILQKHQLPRWNNLEYSSEFYWSNFNFNATGSRCRCQETSTLEGLLKFPIAVRKITECSVIPSKLSRTCLSINYPAAAIFRYVNRYTTKPRAEDKKQRWHRRNSLRNGFWSAVSALSPIDLKDGCRDSCTKVKPKHSRNKRFHLTLFMPFATGASAVVTYFVFAFIQRDKVVVLLQPVFSP